MYRYPDDAYFIRGLNKTLGKYFYWTGKEWVMDITKAKRYDDKPRKGEIPNNTKIMSCVEVIIL